MEQVKGSNCDVGSKTTSLITLCESGLNFLIKALTVIKYFKNKQKHISTKYLDSDISETQTFQLWELIISVFKLSMFKLFLSFIAKLVIAHDSSL